MDTYLIKEISNSEIVIVIMLSFLNLVHLISLHKTLSAGFIFY